FDDCGLVIQAENTRFRVSRDFLAAHSAVFQDMLSIPVPADAETREGCPVVRLPDNIADVIVLLKALLYYESHGFFEPPPAQTSFQIIVGVLRMSHKYEVDALRKRALAHLSALHPTTLHDWEYMDDDSCEWLQKVLDEEGGIPLIILARQLSLDWILPAAFYRVCKHAQADRIIQDPNMHTEDKIHCVSAARVFETRDNAWVLDFLWSPTHIDGCAAARVCPKLRLERRRDAEERRAVWLKVPVKLPLDIWAGMIGMTCIGARESGIHQAAKQRFWNSLPSQFGLPSWVDLEALKAEAFQ
ncbi:hypothetical protein FB45DRAFT_760590, partial [Roridomyces roridus]